MTQKELQNAGWVPLKQFIANEAERLGISFSGARHRFERGKGSHRAVWKISPRNVWVMP